MAYQKDAPASLTLSSPQQGEVNRLIEAAGLDATEFTWAVQPSRYYLIGPLISALVHTPTGASFRFDFLESAHGMNRVSVFAPGEHGQEATKAAASWEDQVQHVIHWLSCVSNAKK